MGHALSSRAPPWVSIWQAVGGPLQPPQVEVLSAFQPRCSKCARNVDAVTCSCSVAILALRFGNQGSMIGTNVCRINCRSDKLVRKGNVRWRRQGIDDARPRDALVRRMAPLPCRATQTLTISNSTRRNTGPASKQRKSLNVECHADTPRVRPRTQARAGLWATGMLRLRAAPGKTIDRYSSAMERRSNGNDPLVDRATHAMRSGLCRATA
jgi:hypothetical protein